MYYAINKGAIYEVKIEDSILNSIKKFLGIGVDYDAFDMDIMIHINSVFSILTQLGVGPSDGFMICDSTSQWSDFIEDEKLFNIIKSYIYLKVRLLFDPPINSSVLDAMKKQIEEFEWRINIYAEGGKNQNG